MSALDEESVGIHRKHEREGCDHASARVTDNGREASVAPETIVPAGSSSSAYRDVGTAAETAGSGAPPASIPPVGGATRHNHSIGGTMDEDEVRHAAEDELGRSLQDIRRLVYEAQAEVESVRIAVGALVESLDRHVAEHERRDRPWHERLGAWLVAGAGRDRRPW